MSWANGWELAALLIAAVVWVCGWPKKDADEQDAHGFGGDDYLD